MAKFKTMRYYNMMGFGILIRVLG